MCCHLEIAICPAWDFKQNITAHVIEELRIIETDSVFHSKTKHPGLKMQSTHIQISDMFQSNVFSCHHYHLNLAFFLQMMVWGFILPLLGENIWQNNQCSWLVCPKCHWFHYIGLNSLSCIFHWIQTLFLFYGPVTLNLRCYLRN